MRDSDRTESQAVAGAHASPALMCPTMRKSVGAALSTEVAVTESQKPLAGRRAIVVDDHPLVLAAVTGYLVSAGCEVVSFSSFTDAKNHMVSSAVDILVTDVRLGAFNGLQLVGLAKSRWPATVAVVISGFDDPVLRREAELMDATFLLKPMTRDELVSAVIDRESDAH